MIKLNLLSPEQISKRQIIQVEPLLFGLIALIAVGCGLVAMRKAQRLASLQKETARLDQDLARLESVVRRVEELEATQNRIRRKIEVIQTLEKSRWIYPVFLEEFSRILHEHNGAWVKSFTTQSKENALEVSLGFGAVDLPKVAELIEILANHPNFSKPEPQLTGGISTQKEEERESRVFQMNFTYVMPEKLP